MTIKLQGDNGQGSCGLDQSAGAGQVAGWVEKR